MFLFHEKRRMDEFSADSAGPPGRRRSPRHRRCVPRPSLPSRLDVVAPSRWCGVTPSNPASRWPLGRPGAAWGSAGGPSVPTPGCVAPALSHLGGVHSFGPAARARVGSAVPPLACSCARAHVPPAPSLVSAPSLCASGCVRGCVSGVGEVLLDCGVGGEWIRARHGVAGRSVAVCGSAQGGRPRGSAPGPECRIVAVGLAGFRLRSGGSAGLQCGWGQTGRA